MAKKIAGYVVLIIMTVLLFFGAKQWIDSKNNRISYLEEAYKRVEGERDTALEELRLKNQSDKASSEVTEKLQENKVTDAKKQTDAEKAVKKKINEINEKYSKLPDTPNNQRLKETEIATERVRGLWKSYCIAEPKAVDCVQ